MLIKKKKEVEIELTEEELKTIEAIKMFQTRIENLKSDLVLGNIDSARYKQEEQIISDELSEYERIFNEQMENPVEFLEQMFSEVKK